MAVRPIVLYPDPILKQRCRQVDLDWPGLSEVVDDLVDTLRAGPGVGVAAPQIGFDLRLFVVDVTPKNPGHGLLVLLNPQLVAGEGRVVGREGCLSIPDYTASVERFSRVVDKGLEPSGQMRLIESEGFEAICLQHELDHLDGILFLDRVACLKTDVFRRKGFKPRFEAESYPKSPGETP